MGEIEKYALLTFAVSFVLGWYVIPHIVLISKRKRLFDKLDFRKEAKPPTPRLGGLAFFPVSLLVFHLVLGLKYVVNDALPTDIESSLLLTFMFLIAGAVMIFLIGLSDDLVGVGYKTKFLAQFASATLLIFAGLKIDDLQNILFFNEIDSIVAGVLTVLVIAFTVNAYNLIDGVNGLCSGLSIVALSVLGGWYLYVHNLVYSVLAFSMLGVVMTFAFYNIRGRRLQIFMGDTGSLTLGYIIIFLALQFNAEPQGHGGEYYEPINKLSLILGLIFVPVFDTFRVFIGRLSRGKSPFKPDRTHIHHLLLNSGLSHNQTTAVLVMGQIGFILLNVILSQVIKLDNNITLLADIAIALGLVYFISKKKKKGAEIISEEPK